MKFKARIFLDSDVIISSLISTTGAAHLLTRTSQLDLYISNHSQKELAIVATRLKLSHPKLHSLIKQFTVITSDQTLNKIKKEFSQYTNDPNDSHIIAGAAQSQADFLITYNLKHYKIETIKRQLNFMILTPGQFLQYLRSLSSS